MKKKYLRVFSVVLSVLMLLSVVTVPVSAAEVIASGTCGDGLTWELDSEYTLTVSGTCAIPDYASVSDAPWEAHIASVKQIIINDGITSIGSNAFAVMFGLEEVTVPGTVETIGEGAFASCFGLREITLPASLKTVEDKAFSACSNLDTVNYFGSEDEWYQISIGSSNSDLEHADIYYDYCPANVSKVHNYSSYVTPATCTEMGYTTYVCDCSKSYVDDYVYPDHTLTYEIIKKPTYLEKGEGIAYCHCGFSYTYTIPVLVVIATGTHGDNVTWVLDEENTLHIYGEGYMKECFGFQGYSWSAYNTKIKKLIVYEGIKNIPTVAFGGERVYALEEIVLPRSLRELGYECFSYTKIESIVIPDNVTVIHDRAFYNCEALEYVDFPADLTTIEAGAFSGCVALKEVKLPDGVTTIENSAFEQCTSLKVLELPYELRTIGDAAFLRCSSLEKIDIPPKVNSIGKCAFEFCRAAVIENIPEGITVLDDHAFAYSASTEIDIPDSMEAVINFSFAYNTQLEAVYIPEEIKEFWAPFLQCISLTDIYYEGSEEDFKNIKNYDSVLDRSMPAEVTVHYNHKCDFNEIERKEATCAKDGYVLYKCKICPNKERDVIPAINGHIKGELISIREPGCLEQGYSKYICLTCGEVFKDDFTDAVCHSNDGYYNESEPTCTAPGQKQYVCKRCQYNLIETTAPLGHDRSNFIEVTAPTCTKTGKGTYECLRCGITEEVELEIIGHNYITEITTPATHMKEGVKTFTCSVCSDSYTETIEKIKDHSYNAVVTPPTCTANGYTTYTCECGDSYVDDEVVAEGHKYVGEVTTPATHLKEGSARYTCSACGDNYTSVIEKIKEHSYTSKVIKESTCTSTGEVLYTCECGHSYTETVAAADHTDENGDFICEVCGKEINPCSHLCHRNNIFAKIVWKIIIFICKIFGLSKTCACGRSHY